MYRSYNYEGEDSEECGWERAQSCKKECLDRENWEFFPHHHLHKGRFCMNEPCFKFTSATDRFPSIPAYMRRVVEQCKLQGYLTTIFHRRRYFPGITSQDTTIQSQAERQAVNFVIQGDYPLYPEFKHFVTLAYMLYQYYIQHTIYNTFVISLHCAFPLCSLIKHVYSFLGSESLPLGKRKIEYWS